MCGGGGGGGGGGGEGGDYKKMEKKGLYSHVDTLKNKQHCPSPGSLRQVSITKRGWEGGGGGDTREGVRGTQGANFKELQWAFPLCKHGQIKQDLLPKFFEDRRSSSTAWQRGVGHLRLSGRTPADTLAAPPLLSCSHKPALTHRHQNLFVPYFKVLQGTSLRILHAVLLATS